MVEKPKDYIENKKMHLKRIGKNGGGRRGKHLKKGGFFWLPMAIGSIINAAKGKGMINKHKFIGSGGYGGGRRRGGGIGDLFQMVKNVITAPMRIFKGALSGDLFKKKPVPAPEPTPYEGQS